MALSRDCTRRGALALLATGALAGCSSLDRFTTEQQTTISSHRLPDIDEEAASEMPVAPAVPVDIGQQHLNAARDRTTTLLARLPTPLGPAEIPNGYVRQELLDAAAEATEHLNHARAAKTELSALQSLRNAREHARYAASGWGFVTDDSSVDELRRAYQESVSRARSFRRRHKYIGKVPIRATLVHARIEEAIEQVLREDPLRPSSDGKGALLLVAEWGRAAESTAALVENANHLNDRLVATLPTGAGDIESTLVVAAKTLLADLRARRSELPPEPTADEWGPTQEIVDELRWEIKNGPTRLAETAGPASAIIDATGRLAHDQALNRIQRRIDTGESFRVETGEAIRTLRSEAYTALKTALTRSPNAALARTVLTDAAGRIAMADHELARLEGDIRIEGLSDAITGYTLGKVLAAVTPSACRQVVETVRTA